MDTGDLAGSPAVSTIDDAIRQAIVEKFFEPTTVLYNSPVTGPNGVTSMQATPHQIEAPVMQIARDVWKANSTAITDAVMARLDTPVLVDQVTDLVTAAVVTRLTSEPDNRWSSNPQPSERQRMLAKVYDAVAEEFGRQCVEHLRATGGLMGILDAPQDSA